MAVKGIEHVAIAVPEIEAALTIWRDRFGFHLEGIEEVPDLKVLTARLELGPHTVELVAPTTPDSHVAKFLAKRGGGIHHLCLKVDNITALLATLAAAGVELIDREPKLGAHGCLIAFVHPRATGGVLVELSEPPFDPHATMTGQALHPATVEQMVREVEAAWAAADMEKLTALLHPEIRWSHPRMGGEAAVVGRAAVVARLAAVRGTQPSVPTARVIMGIAVSGARATVEYASGPAGGGVTVLSILHGLVREARVYLDAASSATAPERLLPL